MKVAISASGKDLEAQVDPRFGRALFFLIVDTDTFAYDVVDNAENLNALKGAGIQAASIINDKGAKVLLTGHCGPNAFKTLQAANIDVVNDVSGTVREVVQAFNAGKYTFAQDANVAGHW